MIDHPRSVAILAAAAIAFAAATPALAQTQPAPAPTPVSLTQAAQTEFLGLVHPETITIDVHNLDGREPWQPGDPIREIPRQHWDDPAVVHARVREPVNRPGLDPLVFKQQAYDEVAGARGAGGFTTPIHNFEGIVGSTLPPDPNGWVGPNHVVETTNGSGGTTVRVWDKETGALAAHFALAPTLQGPGACNSGLGDPIVLYDELAERWVITEFSPSAGRSMCFYISANDDPTNASPGNWNRYAFQSAGFPDYPKYGVWSDAYYVTANESSAAGQRPVYAMDRAKMLAGESAGWVRVNVPSLTGFGFQQLQPAHFTGFNPPPGGAPGIFMRHRDDEAHNSGSNNPGQDYLELWQLSVDWVPATPVGTLTPVHQIAVSEFNSRINGLTAFQAFPQPNGQRLDPLREPVMNVLMYRNFGSHESLVGTLTTNTQTDPQIRGAVRWFELRRTSGGTAATDWVLHDEGTYAPADGGGNIDRWMGAIGIDDSGNIALGYSVVRQSPGVFPGLRYVGRLAGDPPGVLTTGEAVIVDGTRSQNNERWGDYHSMAVDPVDGCTFWFVGEYMGAAGGSNNTRVASFRHDECGDPTFLLNVDVANAAVCTVLPTSLPITASVASSNEYAGTVNLSFNPGLPAGISGAFSPGSVAVPPDASATANLDIDSPAPGQYTLTVQASDGSIVKTRDIVLNVNTAIPVAPELLSPADNAVGLPPQPVLSWQPSDQGGEYFVQVATDPDFVDIVFSGSVVGGSSIAVGTALETGTMYYWRVSSSNECGEGGFSETFRFKTALEPGQCDVEAGQSQHWVYSFDVEGDTTGWSTADSTGAQTWSVSTARPSSGTRSWYAQDIATISDQRLTSPVISLPADQLPLTLMFQNWRYIENNGTEACYDGGLLEISVNGGAFTQLTGEVLNDPYRGSISSSFSNPLADKDAWCEPAPGRPYANTLVDLSSFAGQDVQLRWRLGTDSSQGREGWYVDDIAVQSCLIVTPLPPDIFEDGFEDETN